MKILSKIITILIFSGIFLSSCKAPPLGTYVDPLYLDDENPDANKDSSRKKK